MTTAHVRNLLDNELSNIEASQKFQSMLMYNPDLGKKPMENVLLTYHAFSSACDASILENPLTIGGYVRRGMDKEADLSALVADARKTWGSK